MASTFHVSTEVLSTDLGTEIVLIEGATGHTFRLNETASVLWRALPADVDQLANLLHNRYAINPAQALADARRTIEDLERQQLILRSDDGAGR